MKFHPAFSALCTSLSIVVLSYAAPNTGSPFYGEAPDAHHPWAVHDQNRPQPKRVEPGTFSSAAQPGQPPSDAIILFDGTAASLAKWESDTKPGMPTQSTKWVIRDGALECVPKSGYIRTKEQFADCQLHVEWAAPLAVSGDSQGRGNSGIFLMGLAEVQVLDNYNNPTYADGFAASVYGINPPMANALRAPGEFQVYDIVFRRPVYRNGQLVDAGRLTVFCNGVLMQDATPLEGPGGHMKRSIPIEFPAQGPLKLQDHGNPVRYRNIWYRPLPPRSIEGGTDGALTTEATTAKRHEIATSLRADAAKLNDTAKMLHLAESLCYENETVTAATVDKMSHDYVTGLQKLQGPALEAKKGEAKSVQRAFAFLQKNKIIAVPYAPKTQLDALTKAQGWDDVKK